MKSDDVDLSETNAEILLEVFAFLLTVKVDILGEPREEFDGVKHNPQIVDMWADVHSYLSNFFDHSE